MLKEERQALILNKLHSSGKVVVSRLAVELNVSEDTIRRDLLDLDQKGQVKRVFGGAIPMERPVINFFDRETTDVELKQRLALKALDFLEKDQLVAIDGSSTNLQFAKNIPNGLKLTVLTNSYSIAHACSMKDQVDVIVLGGRLLKESMTNVGETAASQAALYHQMCIRDRVCVHPFPLVKHNVLGRIKNHLGKKQGGHQQRKENLLSLKVKPPEPIGSDSGGHHGENHLGNHNFIRINQGGNQGYLASIAFKGIAVPVEHRVFRQEPCAGKYLGIGLKCGPNHPDKRVYHDKSHQNQQGVADCCADFPFCFSCHTFLPPFLV